jgi:hypothetical protein
MDKDLIPSAINLAAAYYNAARSETLERIRQRDLTLSFYLVAMAAYLGFVTQKHFAPDHAASILDFIILAPMPLICLAFTLIIIQHHIVIGAIGLYVATELDEEVKKTGIALTQWDNSDAASQIFENILSFRFWGQAIILAFPSVYTVAFFLFSDYSKLNNEAIILALY